MQAEFIGTPAVRKYEPAPLNRRRAPVWCNSLPAARTPYARPRRAVGLGGAVPSAPPRLMPAAEHFCHE
jgi:hypothetical protein